MTTPEQERSIVTLEGQLERITFHNETNHYTIARMKTSHMTAPITIVGYVAGISPGENLKVKGSWETHPKYGQQLKIDSYEVTLPETGKDIKIYLQSGIIKGIGSRMARRMVNHFGDETLDIIEHHPKRLTEVAGVGKAKAQAVADAWRSHHTVRLLMQFLTDNGIKTLYGSSILKAYGSSALEVIQKDPYRLTEDLPEEGFVIADSIALKSGVMPDDPKRVKALMLHILQRITNEGNVFIYESTLIQRCEFIFKIDRETITREIEQLPKSGKIRVEKSNEYFPEPALYSEELYIAEKGIAQRINAMLTIPVAPVGMNTEKLLAAVMEKLAIRLSSEQLEALEQILGLRVAVITGGPGTGKTTLIRSVTAVLDKLKMRSILAAPTGRAARRLFEVTKRKAKTIHRLLGYNQDEGSFERNEFKPLETDAVIIDEASMIDTLLMYNLLKAVPVTAILILVGDVFQLPSVGPGNILSDMITSRVIPVCYLKKIFRQAQKSPIVINAHHIRRGESPEIDKKHSKEKLSEFYFIERNNPEDVESLIVRLCADLIPKRFGFDPVNDIQVLTPMHKGAAGTINLNRLLQETLNPLPLENATAGFMTGDKVMHLKNNYQKEVFNGEIGSICSTNRKTRNLTVNYEGREVLYDSEEINQLSLAYAISVHKSQGSEYPVVIMPLVTHHYILLQRNLLYTAVTRAKKLVILTGSRRALDMALKNDRPYQRLSGLAVRLYSGREHPNFKGNI
ncbi:ATP-dependent RecD-like DNA helicase [Desulfobacterales bacterium HSG16]|nr:ATP-dependent RecD-like DNA helicase [Desulfobacterales bacterium HSG16]